MRGGAEPRTEAGTSERGSLSSVRSDDDEAMGRDEIHKSFFSTYPKNHFQYDSDPEEGFYTTCVQCTNPEVISSSRNFIYESCRDCGLRSCLSRRKKRGGRRHKSSYVKFESMESKAKCENVTRQCNSDCTMCSFDKFLVSWRTSSNGCIVPPGLHLPGGGIRSGVVSVDEEDLCDCKWCQVYSHLYANMIVCMRAEASAGRPCRLGFRKKFWAGCCKEIGKIGHSEYWKARTGPLYDLVPGNYSLITPSGFYRGPGPIGHLHESALARRDGALTRGELHFPNVPKRLTERQAYDDKEYDLFVSSSTRDLQQWRSCDGCNLGCVWSDRRKVFSWEDKPPLKLSRDNWVKAWLAAHGRAATLHNAVTAWEAATPLDGSRCLSCSRGRAVRVRGGFAAAVTCSAKGSSSRQQWSNSAFAELEHGDHDIRPRLDSSSFKAKSNCCLPLLGKGVSRTRDVIPLVLCSIKYGGKLFDYAADIIPHLYTTFGKSKRCAGEDEFTKLSRMIAAADKASVMHAGAIVSVYRAPPYVVAKMGKLGPSTEPLRPYIESIRSKSAGLPSIPIRDEDMSSWDTASSSRKNYQVAAVFCATGMSTTVSYAPINFDVAAVVGPGAPGHYGAFETHTLALGWLPSGSPYCFYHNSVGHSLVTGRDGIIDCAYYSDDGTASQAVVTTYEGDCSSCRIIPSLRRTHSKEWALFTSSAAKRNLEWSPLLHRRSTYNECMEGVCLKTRGSSRDSRLKSLTPQDGLSRYVSEVLGSLGHAGSKCAPSRDLSCLDGGFLSSSFACIGLRISGVRKTVDAVARAILPRAYVIRPEDETARWLSLIQESPSRLDIAHLAPLTRTAGSEHLPAFLSGTKVENWIEALDKRTFGPGPKQTVCCPPGCVVRVPKTLDRNTWKIAEAKDVYMQGCTIQPCSEDAATFYQSTNVRESCFGSPCTCSALSCPHEHGSTGPGQLTYSGVYDKLRIGTDIGDLHAVDGPSWHKVRAGYRLAVYGGVAVLQDGVAFSESVQSVDKLENWRKIHGISCREAGKALSDHGGPLPIVAPSSCWVGRPWPKVLRSSNGVSRGVVRLTRKHVCHKDGLLWVSHRRGIYCPVCAQAKETAGKFGLSSPPFWAALNRNFSFMSHGDPYQWSCDAPWSFYPAYGWKTITRFGGVENDRGRLRALYEAGELAHGVEVYSDDQLVPEDCVLLAGLNVRTLVVRLKRVDAAYAELWIWDYIVKDASGLAVYCVRCSSDIQWPSGWDMIKSYPRCREHDRCSCTRYDSIVPLDNNVSYPERWIDDKLLVSTDPSAFSVAEDSLDVGSFLVEPCKSRLRAMRSVVRRGGPFRCRMQRHRSLLCGLLSVSDPNADIFPSDPADAAVRAYARHALASQPTTALPSMVLSAAGRCNGRLVVVTGGPLSGKSALASRLVAGLSAKHIDFSDESSARFPPSASAAHAISRSLISELVSSVAVARRSNSVTIVEGAPCALAKNGIMAAADVVIDVGVTANQCKMRLSEERDELYGLDVGEYVDKVLWPPHVHSANYIPARAVYLDAHSSLSKRVHDSRRAIIGGAKCVS